MLRRGEVTLWPCPTFGLGHGLELHHQLSWAPAHLLHMAGLLNCHNHVHQLLKINHLLTDHIYLYILYLTGSVSLENEALIHRGWCSQWDRQWKRPWINQWHGMMSVRSQEWDTIWDSFLTKLEVSTRVEGLRQYYQSLIFAKVCTGMVWKLLIRSCWKDKLASYTLSPGKIDIHTLVWVTHQQYKL